jgi:hypothetical protein
MFQSLQQSPSVRQFVISVVPVGTIKLQCAQRSGRDHARQWAVVSIGTIESRAVSTEKLMLGCLALMPIVDLPFFNHDADAVANL